ncbi:unnamed protein product [Adineta ricciae]|uniref:NHL repeat containing protein-like protein n=1 Tax=Adineta ricciae TaxID=249248 RepID=A0A815ZXW7_ADIRI|nr:unnamed protein product [Adineta ricciae]
MIKLWSLLLFIAIIFVSQNESVLLCPTATWQRNATTVAGDSAGTSGSNASTLYYPTAVRVDKDSNIYVLDSGNYRVQRFSPNSTIGTTIVNGSAGIAFNQFYNLDDMRIDNSGNIYILDSAIGRVTKWARGASSGVVVAGGNDLVECFWIADTSNHRIVKWISPTSSMIVCGSFGTGNSQFYYPYGLFVDTSDSNTLYVADTFNHRIQIWLAGATSGTTVAGFTGYYGNGLNQLWYPTSVTLDNNRNMFIVDSNNKRILQWAIGLSSGMIIAGDIYYHVAPYWLYDPMNIDFDSNGSLFVADAANNRIQKFLISCPLTENISTTVSPATTSAPVSNISWLLNGTTIAGSSIGWSGSSSVYLSIPTDVAIDRNGTVYVLDSYNGRVQCFDPGSTVVTTVVSGGYGTGWNQFYGMDAMSVDANGSIYIVDSYNNRVMRWSPGATNGTLVAGGYGSGSNANQLNRPSGLFMTYNSSSIWIADTVNSRIVRWDSSATGTVVCGSYGSGASQFYYPLDLFIDTSDSNTLYVADTYNHRIQRWPSGATSGTTVAGQTGTCNNGYNQLCYPGAVVGNGNGYIYIADTSNDRIMRWMVGASYGTVIAGGAATGVLSNQLFRPRNLLLDASGALIVADMFNNRVQKYSPVCVSCTTAASTASTNQSVTGPSSSSSIITLATSTTSAGSFVASASSATASSTSRMTTRTAADGGISVANRHSFAWIFILVYPIICVIGN